jgi:opacity protein-like surface antigen
MSRTFFAAIGCCIMLASEGSAQYQQPVYSPQGQPLRTWSGVGGATQNFYGQTLPNVQTQPTTSLSRASAPIRQDQASGNPTQAQMAPAMGAPRCDMNDQGYRAGCQSCDHPGNFQNSTSSCDGVGSNYFAQNQCGTGCDSCGGCDRYFRVFGGWNWLQEMDVNFQSTAGGDRATFNDGWAIGGAFGKYITERTRRELEFTYRNNTPDAILVPGPVPVDGVINCYSIMGNLVYELPGMQLGGFKPYFGGGLGIAFVDGNLAGDDMTIDDTAFAYQGFVGVDRQLSAQTKMFAEYRYFGTSSIEIDAFVPLTDNYQTNNLFFGLQFSR